MKEQSVLWATTTITTATAVVIAVAITTLSSLQQAKKNQKNQERITCRSRQVPGRIPIIGNWIGWSPDYFMDKVEEWMDLYGQGENDWIEFCLGGKIFVVPCRHSWAMALLSHRPYRLQRFQQFSQAVQSCGADGLFTAEGPTVWSHERRAMAPPLNRHNLDSYLPHIRTITNRLVAKWSKMSSTTASGGRDGIVIINHDLTKYTVDVIGKIGFDIDYHCVDSDHSSQADDLLFLFRLASKRALSLVPYWKIPFIGDYLDGVAFRKNRLLRGFQQMIQEYKRQQAEGVGKNVSQQKTYLAKIMSLADDERLSEKRILGNLMTMFAAGSESTAVTIMTCLWRMLQDENTYHDICTEARAFATIQTCHLPELFQQLPKLRSLFYEVNRYQSAAAALALEAVEGPLTVNDHTFPKGTIFFVHMQKLSHSPLSGVPLGPHGESPTEFCAFRWTRMDDDGRLCAVKPSVKTGVPLVGGFGAGARICPGQDLAEVEAIVCIASLLRAFDISLPIGHKPLKLVARTSMTPDSDIRLILKDRSAASSE
jgi:cytochrome P450